MSRELIWGRITAKLQEIKALPIEPILTVNSEGRGGLFREYLPLFRNIIGFVDLALRFVKPPAIPTQSLANFEELLTVLAVRTRNCCQFVSTNDMSPAGTGQQIQRLSNDLDAAWSNIFHFDTVLRTLDTNKEREFDELKIRFEAATTELITALAKKNEEAESKAKKIDEITDKLIRSAEAAATEDYVKHFNHARIGYLTVAIVCLIIAVALGIMIFQYAYVFFDQKAEATNWQQFWEHYLPRVLPMVVLLTFLMFALKQFQSAMHNVAVYLHRKIVMQTFQAFRDSSTDENVKNSILLHAVENAVDLHATGYLSGQTETPQINQINDIKKNLAGS